MENYTLLGVRFERLGVKDARGRIREMLKKRGGCAVFTPNAQMLYRASRDERARRLLTSADLLLPDGVGISLACRLRGLPSVPRITGIDTARWLLDVAQSEGLSVYLLGGEDGVAALAAKRLVAELPRLKIAGVHHGYFDKSPCSEQNARIVEKIRRASPDIVFVCFGFPSQERWIVENARSLPSVRIFMGLGGSLDVWSGKVKRAPEFMQAAGLEWLWRCTLDPRRLRTLAELPLFLLKTLREDRDAIS